MSRTTEARPVAVGTTVEADAAAILNAHAEWWAANHGLDIDRMRSSFPAGDRYLMFNLQGHPYYGIEEKTKLWAHYADQIEVPEEPVTRVVRLELRGDMAWLAAEVLFTLGEKVEGGIGATSAGYEPQTSKHRIRSTEVYHRDDGDGNPRWTMWHFHCSPLPSADEPRPPFGDTARDRGELVP